MNNQGFRERSADGEASGTAAASVAHPTRAGNGSRPRGRGKSPVRQRRPEWEEAAEQEAARRGAEPRSTDRRDLWGGRVTLPELRTVNELAAELWPDWDEARSRR